MEDGLRMERQRSETRGLSLQLVLFGKARNLTRPLRSYPVKVRNSLGKERRVLKLRELTPILLETKPQEILDCSVLLSPYRPFCPALPTHRGASPGLAGGPGNW